MPLHRSLLFKAFIGVYLSHLSLVSAFASVTARNSQDGRSLTAGIPVSTVYTTEYVTDIAGETTRPLPSRTDDFILTVPTSTITTLIDHHTFLICPPEKSVFPETALSSSASTQPSQPASTSTEIQPVATGTAISNHKPFPEPGLIILNTAGGIAGVVVSWRIYEAVKVWSKKRAEKDKKGKVEETLNLLRKLRIGEPVSPPEEIEGTQIAFFLRVREARNPGSTFSPQELRLMQEYSGSDPLEDLGPENAPPGTPDWVLQYTPDDEPVEVTEAPTGPPNRPPDHPPNQSPHQPLDQTSERPQPSKEGKGKGIGIARNTDTDHKSDSTSRTFDPDTSSWAGPRSTDLSRFTTQRRTGESKIQTLTLSTPTTTLSISHSTIIATPSSIASSFTTPEPSASSKTTPSTSHYTIRAMPSSAAGSFATSQSSSSTKTTLSISHYTLKAMPSSAATSFATSVLSTSTKTVIVTSTRTIGVQATDTAVQTVVVSPSPTWSVPPKPSPDCEDMKPLESAWRDCCQYRDGVVFKCF